MGIDPAMLNDKQRAMIAPKDRAKVGRKLETSADAASRQTAQLERELQRDVIGLLRRNGITPIWSATSKKTSNNIGTPDILFAVRGIAVAWELKIPPHKLDEAQEEMRNNLLCDGWRYAVITTYEQALITLSWLLG